MISIIVPTVEGRERYLKDCLSAYDRYTTDYEVQVLIGRETCGQAWLDGADKADGDYIHFSADDLEPLDGWWQSARQVADIGILPAPRILNSDGSLQTCGGADGFAEVPTGHLTDFTRIPFLTREQWDRIRPLVEDFLRAAHYYTDNAISWAAGKTGTPTAVHRGYAFVHHLAQEKRGAGMAEPDRMLHDFELFKQLINS